MGGYRCLSEVGTVINLPATPVVLPIQRSGYLLFGCRISSAVRAQFVSGLVDNAPTVQLSVLIPANKRTIASAICTHRPVNF